MQEYFLDIAHPPPTPTKNGPALISSYISCKITYVFSSHNFEVLVYEFVQYLLVTLSFRLCFRSVHPCPDELISLL